MPTNNLSPRTQTHRLRPPSTTKPTNHNLYRSSLISSIIIAISIFHAAAACILVCNPDSTRRFTCHMLKWIVVEQNVVET
jgi:hypothetical protein